MNPAPTIFVIFGVTGDLSQKKLIPSLYNLFTKGFLPKKFKIVGFSRREWTDADLHAFITEVLAKKGITGDISAFLKYIEYAKGVFDDIEAYKTLKTQLDRIDTDFGQCSNKLLYLSVSPAFYATIFKSLEVSKLNLPCGGDLGWTRILVEKPFGKDLTTANLLEKQLAKIFKEAQIFRIDHYLAKESVQNILAFRFANSLFEQIWNGQSIDRVEISLFEKDGVGLRGEFYEGVGALRDMGQNHVLQMLALIAMEQPTSFDAAHIREKRTEILQKLVLVSGSLVRGQYKGFTEEKGIAITSQTETYFKAMVNVKNPRWKNVPFILENGKGMKESKIEIVVYFKTILGTQPNTISFHIQPNEGIDINFWIKKPGFDQEFEQKSLAFSYGQEHLALPEAYERVLFDCIRGDQTLFASTAEVTASWKFITPILEQFKQLPLMPYTKHTNGPLVA